MKFSERMGIVKAKDTIQLESMDDDLRVGLWNIFQIFFLDKMDEYFLDRSPALIFFQNLWLHHLKKPLDTLDSYKKITVSKIRSLFFDWEWYEAYDFIEYLAGSDFLKNHNSFETACNYILARDRSGYRLVDGLITPITNEHEINEIDDAITNTKGTLTQAQTHLNQALKMMSDRQNPDYRNSIKESISAIETVAKKIANDDKTSLGSALNIIKEKIGLHPSLEQGFKKLYGYTSDADGIRHSLSEESSCDFEDAKYMLVTSSAFINYLITKTDKAGIKI